MHLDLKIVASPESNRLKPSCFVLAFDRKASNPADKWKLYFAGDRENYPIAIQRVNNLGAELLGKSLEEVQKKAPEIGRIIKNYRDFCLIPELSQLIEKVQEGMFPLREADAYLDCSPFANATVEIGSADLKNDPAKYIEQTSRALDFMILKGFNIIAAKTMNGELGLSNFNQFLDQIFVNQAARYMGSSKLPHVVNERLFLKMVWIEWMLESIKQLRLENRITFGWLADTLFDSHVVLGKRSEHTTRSLNEFAAKPENKKFLALLQDFRKAHPKKGEKFDIESSFKRAQEAFLKIKD